VDLAFSEAYLRFPNDSEESLNAGLCPTKNQCVDVVGAFVGVDDFEIHEMARNPKLIGNAIAAQHISGHSSNIKRLSTGVSLQQY
jgi:hypothetical protein